MSYSTGHGDVRLNMCRPKGGLRPETSLRDGPFEPDPDNTGVGIGESTDSLGILIGLQEHHMARQLPFHLTGWAFCLLLPQIVFAQAADDTLVIEEVIVTGEFRDADISSLPASVSVIRPNTDGTTVQHLEEVLNRAPNVNFASGASRARFIQIRGIGERGQFSDPLNSSVGLLVDGVDLSGIGTAATLFDVEQVEVFRGPQGTLYGANALAGLISVVTPDPSVEHTFGLRLDGGDYGARGIGGVVSGPLSEQAGYRISAQRYQDDGFLDNEFLNSDDTNEHDESTYRAKFTWSGEMAQWAVNLGRVDVDNGYDAFSLDNDRSTRSDSPGRDIQETNYGSISLVSDVGERVSVEASLGFADSEIDYGYDEDWTFVGFDPAGYSSTDRYERDRQTNTAEVRFLSKPGQGLADGSIDWVVGLYRLSQEVDLARQYTFLTDIFRSQYDVDRLAVYAEFSRALTDQLQLTLGGRYEQHEADYDDGLGVNFSPEDDLFGGRALLEYTLDSGSLIYGGITQGYKSGGFNINGSLPADLREFDPETLWNVELGYKARLVDDRLLLNATVFRMQRDDVQISTSTTRPIANSSAVEFISYTGNAAEGYNQGVELEATFVASAQLTLFANAGYLDSRYIDYIDNSGRDLDGRDQAHAPSYQFYLGAEYAFTDDWSGQLEVEGKDEFFFSASHPSRSESYELINASIAYTAEHWRLSLWGRNLADEDYPVRGFFFGNDPRDGYTARTFTQLGAPRQVGVTLEANW